MQLCEAVAQIDGLILVDEEGGSGGETVVHISPWKDGVEGVISASLEDEDHLLVATAGIAREKFATEEFRSGEGRQNQPQCSQATGFEEISAIQHFISPFLTGTGIWAG